MMPYFFQLDSGELVNLSADIRNMKFVIDDEGVVMLAVEPAMGVKEYYIVTEEDYQRMEEAIYPYFRSKRVANPFTTLRQRGQQVSREARRLFRFMTRIGD